MFEPKGFPSIKLNVSEETGMQGKPEDGNFQVRGGHIPWLWSFQDQANLVEIAELGEEGRDFGPLFSLFRGFCLS